MRKPTEHPINHLEFQVLLVLAEGPSYGYAIMKGVEEQSSGRHKPDVGSLYRLLARLSERGLAEEQSAPKGSTFNHRGRPRKYYGLTPRGLEAVRNEAHHLAGLVAQARSHQLLPSD